MQHKGLIYTICGVFVIACMAALVAFSLDRRDRVALINSSPAGAEVYINGKYAGLTPLELPAPFLNSDKGGRKNLLRFVEAFSDGILLRTPKNPKGDVITFKTAGGGAVPTIFEKAATPSPLPEKVGAKFDFLIISPDSDTITAVFERKKIPDMGEAVKMNSEIYAFKNGDEDASVAELSEFKAFKIRPRGMVVASVLAPAKASGAALKTQPKAKAASPETKNDLSALDFKPLENSAK